MISKRKLWGTTSKVLLILVLIIAAPLCIFKICTIINLATSWTGNDILSYYGSVLESLISVFVLRETILYTRMQIEYEHLEDKFKDEIMESRNELSSYVDALYPLKLYKLIVDYSLSKDNTRVRTNLIDYQFELKIVRNRVHMNDSLSNLDNYLDTLDSMRDQLIHLADEIRGIIEMKCDIIKKEERLEVIVNHLISLSNKEYKEVLANQEDIYSDLERNAESQLRSVIIH